MDKNNSYFTLGKDKKLKIIFFVIFFIIIAAILYIFQYYFWPFLFALILYMAIRPYYDKFSVYVKNRTLCTTLVIIFLFISIILPILYLIYSLADQTYQLYVYLNIRMETGLIDEIYNIEFVKNIMNYFDIHAADVIKKSTEFIEKAAVGAFGNLTKLISFQISFVMNFFFMALILFFLLKDGHKMDKALYKILPFPDDIERKIVNKLKEVIKVLLAGNLAIMIFQGLSIGIGFYLAGIGMPVLWGSLAGVLSLIPVVGTAFIWLPAVIYLALNGSYLGAAFVGIWSLVAYLVLENLAKPKVFGKKLNFHPVVFFFLLLGSIQAFGIAGIIIGPILLTLFFSFWEIYKFLDEYNIWNREGDV